MFAGAAREVVFSNRKVVRQIQQRFVPVALKAALVNGPPQGVEGQLYAEIGRSKPAPQGICVVNSAGKVLAWALSFDDDNSIAEFLDYAAKRYRQFPDATKSVTTERFRSYPSLKLPDVADAGQAIVVPLQHDDDERCPAVPVIEQGTLLGRVIGRALDKDGHPLLDTLRQEHYLESQFHVAVGAQRLFIDALRTANGKRFSLPDPLIESIVGAAYLGQLDVHPLGQVPGSQNYQRSWAFTGQQVPANDAKSIRIRVTGQSDVAGGQRTGAVFPSGLWDHAVQLSWQGYIEVKDNQILSLALLADGHEKLRRGSPSFNWPNEPDSKHLMAGHAIDLDGGVRYGLIAQPVDREKESVSKP